MKNLQDIFSVTKEVEAISNNSTLVTEIQNLSRQRSNSVGQVVAPVNYNISIDNIKKILASVNTSLWTNEHWEIAKILGIDKFLGPEGSQYIEQTKLSIASNSSNKVNIIMNLVTELNNFRTKPKQIATLLNDFGISSNIKTISDDEGIIEITFEGNVDIGDFKGAKDNMNDWFLIIEGYSRLLNVPREEFEIINISKNSPTKFKLKTSLKSVTMVLGIFTSILVIQRSYLDNQLLLEKLRQTSLSPDLEAQRQFIENAENHMQNEIDNKIEKLVNDKLEEYKIEENIGEVKTSLKKSVENQYNFVNKGGNINIYITNGDLKPQVEQLQKTKEEIKNIRTSYDYQKSITSGDTLGQEKLNLE